jgi:hypothetical protein
MNEIYFDHNGYTFLKAQLPIEPVKGEGDIILPMLKIPMRFHYDGESRYKNILPLELHGRLQIGQQLLAFSKPCKFNIELNDQQRDWVMEIIIPLSLSGIEYIESARNGDLNLTILLELQFLYYRKTNSILSNGVSNTTANFTIPQSEWINNVLPGIGFNKKMLIELLIPEIEENNLAKDSILSLDKARHHFNQGQYDDAVAKCRMALEPFFEKTDSNGKSRKVFKDNWKQQLGESTYTWLTDTARAITVASNKPHHSPKEHYDRNESQLILITTTSIVSFITSAIESEA